MTDLDALEQDVRTLEGHVLGQEKDSPGVLMRLDRLELMMKLGVAAGGIGLAWKVLDVFGSLIAMKAASP